MADTVRTQRVKAFSGIGVTMNLAQSDFNAQANTQQATALALPGYSPNTFGYGNQTIFYDGVNYNISCTARYIEFV